MIRSTAMVLCVLCVCSSIASAQQVQTTVRGPIVAPGAETATIRLMYPGASWRSVLEDLAEAGKYELVMPMKPTGRFERYDVRPVPVDRAIDLVNEELASQGLRVMPRGKYLIVLEDEAFRSVYPRFQVEPRQAAADRATAQRTAQLSPNTPQQARPERTNRVSSRADAVISRLGHGIPHGPGITQASFESTADDVVEPLFPQPAGQMEAAYAISNTLHSTVVRPKAAHAADMARAVVQAYGKNVELIDAGPQGLPAFRIATVNDQQHPIQWTVGVDVDADRIAIDAPPEAAQQLVDLFHKLDRQPGEQPIMLAAASTRVHSAALGLSPIVNSMLAMQADDTNAPPVDANQPLVGEASSSDDITRILDRIRSNVSVESLDELGLLILRGNEKDVEAVMQIIDAIEKQSAGTTPEVHLRVLADVDSSAMADLLNGVYEAVQSIETRPGRDDKRVSVIPVVRPNAVLIVAPSVELPAILDLVDNLDKPVDPATELRVYRLKFATASRAVETLTEFYEERGGLGTRVRASADSRTNSVIVQARPNDLAEVDRLLARIDRADGGSVSRMQLFPLRNAVATELADFLNEAIEDAIEPRQTGGATVGQGARENRSVVLEFLQAGDAAAELIRSGVLEDVRISADPRTNTVAVVAPERSIPLFAAVIESLDIPSAATVEVKVFTLANADASAAVELLDELFEQDGTEDPVGVQLSGTNDSASNLLPIRFSVDVRTNSIVATGGPDALTVVEAILIRLDSSDARMRTTQVLKLKNSYAPDVATAINDFLEAQRELSSANPDLVSTVELLNREVIVVAEEVSNNLLISATEEYLSDILRIAAELDAPVAQVVVQAMLVEVLLDNADEFGVELGFQDSVLFDRGLSTNTAIASAGSVTVVDAVREPGFRFNDLTSFPNLGNVPTASSKVGEQALSHFALGRVSDLGFGGLVLSASSEAVNVLVRALSQHREVRVLSRPQIRTVDGQLAQIQVGQSVPVINGITNTGNNGVVSPNIEYDDSGLILDVTPRISPDGQIVMEVIAERSAYDLDNGVPVYVDATTGTTIQSPIKDITVARSTVSIANGQTIVLGGLISERNESIIRKVPYLGDIPILGRAFRYDQNSNLRTELLIFLTPRIIGGDQDNAVIKEVEAGRLHWFREEAEAMHGPIFDVPQPMDGAYGMPHEAEGYCPPELMEPYATEVTSPDDVGQFLPTPTPTLSPEVSR